MMKISISPMIITTKEMWEGNIYLYIKKRTRHYIEYFRKKNKIHWIFLIKSLLPSSQTNEPRSKKVRSGTKN